MHRRQHRSERAVHRAHTFGRWHPFTDATPVREHIRALRAAGIGVEQIATLAGIATSHVRQLAAADGTPAIRRVRPDTTRRVLSIGIDQAHWHPRSRLDATGTRRRLQALIAIGWTEAQLATQLGRGTASLRRSMASEWVTAQAAGDVHALYQWLWNIQSPRGTQAQRGAAEAARS